MSTLLAAPTADPALAGRVLADAPPLRIATIGLRHQSPSCASRARGFIDACCMSMNAPESARYNARQCISELTANVVNAGIPTGRGWFYIQAFRSGPHLLVRVHDPVLTLPSPHVVDVDALLADPDEDAAIGGWGLSSVMETLADGWRSAFGPRWKFVEFRVWVMFEGLLT